MSEKQFDHIENRIREAVENNEPVFDEYAWKLMEARLDAEDKRRRRPIFWIIAFASLVIVGGTIYYFGNTHQADKINSQQVESTINKEKSGSQKNITATSQTVISPANESGSPTNISSVVNSGTDQGSNKVFNHSDIPADDLNRNSINGKRSHQTKGKVSSKTITAESSEQDDIAVTGDKPENNPAKPVAVENADIAVTKVVLDEPMKKDSSKAGTPVVVTNNTANKKMNTSKPSGFYFIGAIGIDAGSVKLLSLANSKATAKYGIGIGYQLNKKLSVQTGFYASQKKYIAGPDDYYAKPGSYWSMVQIVKVDAACLVYDIPITVRFDFLQKSKTTYFATAGISSYIMKKEDYNYYYNRNNVAHEASKTYTGNVDPFSVFNLSAGIERKLSPKFYLQVEPSIGIPISGVGEGSVKLYSAALQVALKYQPVKKH